MAIPRWAGAVDGGFKDRAVPIRAYLAFTQWFDKNLELPEVGMIEYGAAGAWPRPGVPLQQIRNALITVGKRSASP